MGRSQIPVFLLAQGCFIGLLLATSSAVAAPPETNQPDATPTAANVPASAPSARTDIVKLKNGGIVRGTLDENLPGEYVVITTPSGTTKRFEWNDIEYAGPADASTAPARPTDQEPPVQAVSAASADGAPAPAVPMEQASAGGKMHPVRIAGIVVGSTGIALTIAAVVMQLKYSSADDALEQLCGTDNDCTNSTPRPLTIQQQNEARSLNNDVKIFDSLRWPFAVVGVPGMIAGTVMFFAAPRTSQKTTATWQFVPSAPRSDLGGISVVSAF
jgi:hypothetical protein